MNYEAYSSRSYLPELDGLRAFSILIVISVHMKDHVWGWLAGQLGVTVFFVLSGYLITMLALREERMRGALDLPAFFVRRVFRLFPLYYLVLALYCFLIFGLNWSPEKREMLSGALPYYLIYFQEYPFFVGVNGSYQNVPFYQSWSLGIEEKFYLVWPLLGFLMWRRARVLRLTGALLLWAFAALAPVILGLDVGKFFFPYSHILIGCIVALLLDEPRWFDRLHWLGNPIAGLIATGALLAAHFTYPYVPWVWQKSADVSYSLVTAFFLGTVLLGNGVVQRCLRFPALVTIGKLSYGIYLIHLLALNVADKLVKSGSGSFLHAAAAYLLASALSIAVAYGLNVAIERPGIAVGKRLSSLLQRRRDEGLKRAVAIAAVQVPEFTGQSET